VPPRCCRLVLRGKNQGYAGDRYLFHLFYQVQIRFGSPFRTLRGHGKVEESWAGPDDTDNSVDNPAMLMALL
jgi:hypothetical protein